jgi:hypothetical protein
VGKGARGFTIVGGVFTGISAYADSRDKGRSQVLSIEMGALRGVVVTFAGELGASLGLEYGATVGLGIGGPAGMVIGGGLLVASPSGLLSSREPTPY